MGKRKTNSEQISTGRNRAENGTPMKMDVKERFFRHVQKTESCWLWTGGINNRGYGRFRVGDMYLAHRAAWFFEHGKIPDGLCVLHDCPEGDTRSCVNPAHLFLGTNKDNTQDMLRKKRGRPPIGERARSARLTVEKVISIRDRYFSGGLTMLDLAKEHVVGKSSIRAIINREHWKHVPPSEIEKNYHARLEAEKNRPPLEASQISELIQERQSRGFPQTVLARASGISSSHLSQLENGKHKWTWAVFNSLKSALAQL